MKNELAVPARIEHIPPMSVTFLERRENRTTGPNAAQSPEIENARILKEFEPISAESANERREKIRTLKNLTYPISFLSTSERINGYISSAKNPDAIRIFAFVTAERTPKTATRRRQRTKRESDSSKDSIIASAELFSGKSISHIKPMKVAPKSVIALQNVETAFARGAIREVFIRKKLVSNCGEPRQQTNHPRHIRRVNREIFSLLPKSDGKIFSAFGYI